MLGAFRLSFPQHTLPFPYRFHSLLVFIRFAMTFHLGGLDIKAPDFWSWGTR